MLNVISNGPTCQAPKGLDYLLNMLAEHPLDPVIHDIGFWGNARQAVPGSDPEDDVFVDGPPIYPDAPNAIRFCGNFMEISSGFCIDTDEPDLIAKLTKAIQANQLTEAYRLGLVRYRQRREERMSRFRRRR